VLSTAAFAIVFVIVCDNNVNCRSAQILQPVQHDYAAQILTLPTVTRMVYDETQSTPVSVVGQSNRPTLGILISFLITSFLTRLCIFLPVKGKIDFEMAYNVSSHVLNPTQLHSACCLCYLL